MEFKLGEYNRGLWRTTEGNINILEHIIQHEDINIKDPGQIDCLVETETSMYVIECKSLYTLGNPDKVWSKLIESEKSDYHEKMVKKCDYIQKYNPAKKVVPILLLEGFSINVPLSVKEYTIYTWDMFSDEYKSIIV